MSKIAHVVEGEASESDSEVELAKYPDPEKTARSCVIAGEAPESDDEEKLKPQAEASPIKTPVAHNSPNKIIYNSLLHQKLWDCNVSLRATIEGLVKHTVDISADKLTRADKALLDVQESMRATNANLTLARTRLRQLHAELERANCSSALSTVTITP